MRFALGLSLLLVACVGDVSGIHQTSQDPPVTGGDNGSGSGSGESGADTSTTPTGYLKQIAAIYCMESFSCRTEFPTDLGYTFEAAWGTTPDECQQRLLDSWNPPAIETEIAKGRVTYDGAAGIACLNGVTFGSCADYWTNGIQWADACYHVIVGSVPAGGSCDTLYACTSGSCDMTAHQCL
jgi:hypothetical protein